MCHFSSFRCTRSDSVRGGRINCMNVVWGVLSGCFILDFFRLFDSQGGTMLCFKDWKVLDHLNTCETYSIPVLFFFFILYCLGDLTQLRFSYKQWSATVFPLLPQRFYGGITSSYVCLWYLQSLHARLQKVIFRNAQVMHRLEHSSKQRIQYLFRWGQSFLCPDLFICLLSTCCSLLSRSEAQSQINNCLAHPSLF